MQIAKILINYASNYNGCNLVINDEFDSYDLRENEELSKKLEDFESEIVEKAGEDLVERGRHEGMFIGDIDELEEYAIKRATEVFGEGIEIVFEEDDMST